MAISTTDALLEALAKSQLLEAAQLAEARAAVQPGDDARSLAKRLAEQELLTRWQAAQLLAGRTSFLLGKYKLIDLLGRGGMGRVFLARHTMMHRPVALKIISKQLGQDPSNLERFFSEARAVAALNHPNIVHAYNIDNEGDRYYMVMEFVEGEDLQRIVDEDGPLEYAVAADCIHQAAEGLAHAHSRNIIHCDIKPANLLVNPQGVIKILDMGMARLASPDELVHDPAQEANSDVLGTVDYMAPELAMQSPHVDHRVDIYSLGCTLYFLLTGHPPFPEGSLAERILKHQMETPEPILHTRPDCPAELIAICQKMMAKQPEDRYASAADVAAALAERLAASSVQRSAATSAVEPSLTLADESTVSAAAAATPAAALSPEARAALDATPAEGSPLDFAEELLPPPPAVPSLPSHGTTRKPAAPASRFPWVVVLSGVGAVLVLLVIVAIFLGGIERPPTGAVSPPRPAPTSVRPTTTSSTPPEPNASQAVGPPATAPPKPPLPSPGATTPPAAQPSPSATRSTGRALVTPAEAVPPKPVETAPKPEASSVSSSPVPSPEAKSPGPPATSPVKPAVVTTVPAGESPKEPGAAEAPPVDPFAGLPPQVAIPLVGEEGAQASFILGRLETAPDAPWQLELLGGDEVLTEDKRYRLEPTSTPPASAGWIVRREVPVVGTEKTLSNDLARLWRGDDGTLCFQWLAGAKAEEANYLRNCLLRVRLPAGTRDVALLTATPVEPVALELERRGAHAVFDLKWIRQPSDLRAEILQIDGPFPCQIIPPGALAFGAPVPVHLVFPRGAAGNVGAEFLGTFGVYHGREGKYIARFTLQTPASDFKHSRQPVADQRQRLLGEEAQLETALKTAQGPQRNTLQFRLRGLKEQLWNLEFGEAIRTAKITVHFQIFLEIAGQRVILASTEVPSPETSPAPPTK